MLVGLDKYKHSSLLGSFVINDRKKFYIMGLDFGATTFSIKTIRIMGSA